MRASALTLAVGALLLAGPAVAQSPVEQDGYSLHSDEQQTWRRRFDAYDSSGTQNDLFDDRADANAPGALGSSLLPQWSSLTGRLPTRFSLPTRHSGEPASTPDLSQLPGIGGYPDRFGFQLPKKGDLAKGIWTIDD